MDLWACKEAQLRVETWRQARIQTGLKNCSSNLSLVLLSFPTIKAYLLPPGLGGLKTRKAVENASVAECPSRSWAFFLTLSMSCFKPLDA